MFRAKLIAYCCAYKSHVVDLWTTGKDYRKDRPASVRCYTMSSITPQHSCRRIAFTTTSTWMRHWRYSIRFCPNAGPPSLKTSVLRHTMIHEAWFFEDKSIWEINFHSLKKQFKPRVMSITYMRIFFRRDIIAAALTKKSQVLIFLPSHVCQ